VQAQDDSKEQMHNVLFGADTNTKYPSDVKFVQRYLSIFPIDEESVKDSPLNEMDWKYIFLYDDHISVFKSNLQNEPPSFLSEENAKPA